MAALKFGLHLWVDFKAAVFQGIVFYGKRLCLNLVSESVECVRIEVFIMMKVFSGISCILNDFFLSFSSVLNTFFMNFSFIGCDE